MKHATNQLRSTDYDHLLTLAGELGSLPHDPIARRRHAMSFLRSILPSRSAMFVQTGVVKGKYRLIAPVLVGLDDAPAGVLPEYFAGKRPLDPCAPLMERALPRGSYTRTRRMLVNDRVWYTSGYFDAVAKPLGLDDGLYSRAVSPRGNVFGIALLRERGDRPMEERQRQILAAFTERLSPLCELDGLIDPTLDDVPPRYRALVQRFVAGDSSKEAARHLNLSIHTVREYAKRLHRLFGVSTRTELVSRVLKRSI